MAVGGRRAYSVFSNSNHETTGSSYREPDELNRSSSVRPARSQRVECHHKAFALNPAEGPNHSGGYWWASAAIAPGSSSSPEPNRIPQVKEVRGIASTLNSGNSFGPPVIRPICAPQAKSPEPAQKTKSFCIGKSKRTCESVSPGALRSTHAPYATTAIWPSRLFGPLSLSVGLRRALRFRGREWPERT
jgi:hypothetical protein